jgi:spermidine synthase
MAFSLLHRGLSYLYPIPVEKGMDLRGKPVRLELYRDQLMLSTALAVYSYGTRYHPFQKPFAHLGHELQTVKRFLLLGTGLGSALQILQQKHGVFPEAILVDQDPLMLHWSKRYMSLNTRNNVEWICADAEEFVQEDEGQHDLIGLDIFCDMTPPQFVKTEAYYRALYRRLNPGGMLIFNVFFSSLNEQHLVETRLQEVFRSTLHIPHDRNSFYICRA